MIRSGEILLLGTRRESNGFDVPQLSGATSKRALLGWGGGVAMGPEISAGAGKYTTLEDQRRVTIWRAELAAHPSHFLAVPGQGCCRIGNDPVIACSNGVMHFTDVELEGWDGNDEAKRMIGQRLRSRLV